MYQNLDIKWMIFNSFQSKVRINLTMDYPSNSLSEELFIQFGMAKGTEVLLKGAPKRCP